MWNYRVIFFECILKEAGFDANFLGGPHELNWGLVQWSPMNEAIKAANLQ